MVGLYFFRSILAPQANATSNEAAPTPTQHESELRQLARTFFSKALEPEGGLNRGLLRTIESKTGKLSLLGKVLIHFPKSTFVYSYLLGGFLGLLNLNNKSIAEGKAMLLQELLDQATFIYLSPDNNKAKQEARVKQFQELVTRLTPLFEKDETFKKLKTLTEAAHPTDSNLEFLTTRHENLTTQETKATPGATTSLLENLLNFSFAERASKKTINLLLTQQWNNFSPQLNRVEKEMLLGQLFKELQIVDSETPLQIRYAKIFLCKLIMNELEDPEKVSTFLSILRAEKDHFTNQWDTGAISLDDAIFSFEMNRLWLTVREIESKKTIEEIGSWTPLTEQIIEQLDEVKSNATKNEENTLTTQKKEVMNQLLDLAAMIYAYPDKNTDTQKQRIIQLKRLIIEFTPLLKGIEGFEQLKAKTLEKGRFEQLKANLFTKNKEGIKNYLTKRFLDNPSQALSSYVTKIENNLLTPLTNSTKKETEASLKAQWDKLSPLLTPAQKQEILRKLLGNVEKSPQEHFSSAFLAQKIIDELNLPSDDSSVTQFRTILKPQYEQFLDRINSGNSPDLNTDRLYVDLTLLYFASLKSLDVSAAEATINGFLSKLEGKEEWKEFFLSSSLNLTEYLTSPNLLNQVLQKVNTSTNTLLRKQMVSFLQETYGKAFIEGSEYALQLALSIAQSLPMTDQTLTTTWLKRDVNLFFELLKTDNTDAKDLNRYAYITNLSIIYSNENAQEAIKNRFQSILSNMDKKQTKNLASLYANRLEGIVDKDTLRTLLIPHFKKLAASLSSSEGQKTFEAIEELQYLLTLACNCDLEKDFMKIFDDFHNSFKKALETNLTDMTYEQNYSIRNYLQSFVVKSLFNDHDHALLLHKLSLIEDFTKQSSNPTEAKSERKKALFKSLGTLFYLSKEEATSFLKLYQTLTSRLEGDEQVNLINFLKIAENAVDKIRNSPLPSPSESLETETKRPLPTEFADNLILDPKLNEAVRVGQPVGQWTIDIGRLNPETDPTTEHERIVRLLGGNETAAQDAEKIMTQATFAGWNVSHFLQGLTHTNISSKNPVNHAKIEKIDNPNILRITMKGCFRTNLASSEYPKLTNKVKGVVFVLEFNLTNLGPSQGLQERATKVEITEYDANAETILGINVESKPNPAYSEPEQSQIWEYFDKILPNLNSTPDERSTS